MDKAYEIFYNSRFYRYFSMLVDKKNELEKHGVKFLFVQTPLRQNIRNLSEFEQQRLDNWQFDFNHISEQDCEIIKQIYPEDITVDYLQQLYDGSKVYEQAGVKYLADFQSQYVNIVAGKRITKGNPSIYRNKVWVYGQCTTRGTGVEDGETIPSYLQVLLNDRYVDTFMVVNGATGCGSDIYDDLMHMNEERFKSGDIVILCTNLEIVPNKLFEENNIAYYDSSVIFHRPHGYGEWFTDSTFHTNAKGNAAIAQFIWNVLEERNWLKPSDVVDGGYLEATINDSNILSYQQEIESYLEQIRAYKRDDGRKGCIVMNCNPFTKGHRYVIEYAAAQVDYLYIFVVQENKSFFTFEDRFELVKKGTVDIANVTVLPSGQFVLSALTFPGYFYKDNCQDVSIDTSMDLKIFGRYVAPALDISIRFAGTEPTDFVTRQYNASMREQLPLYGIEFVEIERKLEGEQVISASRVRKYLEQKNFEEIRPLVPNSTYEYLKEKFG